MTQSTIALSCQHIEARIFAERGGELKKKTEKETINVWSLGNVITVLPCGGCWAGPLEGNQVTEDFTWVARVTQPSRTRMHKARKMTC